MVELTVTHDEVLDAMAKHGGAFAQALATAWRHADQINNDRLATTFEDYYLRYEEIAKEDKAQAEGGAG